MAPPVQFGVQTFGNTANGAGWDCCWKVEWYTLKLIAGDHVTIKFENGAPGVGVDWLRLYIAGTDDFNVTNQRHADQSMESNDHAQYDDDMPQSGTYALGFFAGSSRAGAYDFTATVKHRSRLRIDATRIPRRGTLAVSARYPDGTQIASGLGATLYGSWGGVWHKLGKAAAVAGVIRIPYAIPAAERGKRIRIAANAGGPTFYGARVVKTVTVG